MTDAELYWRARVAGWSPRAEHCPVGSAVLGGAWREHARRWLALPGVAA